MAMKTWEIELNGLWMSTICGKKIISCMAIVYLAVIIKHPVNHRIRIHGIIVPYSHAGSKSYHPFTEDLMLEFRSYGVSAPPNHHPVALGPVRSIHSQLPTPR
ncbi:Uncharacterized protein HZ326_23513 [Fusarium oxysporum f. sp. albedinis]|nr:Uncharacterized protein HZ326_23513 [Fusarium oxysporum f. sp. albedinis]